MPFGGVKSASGNVLEGRTGDKRMVQEITAFTYYNGQRKVFQAAVSESEVCFIEVPARSVVAEMATSDQCGELWVDIRARAGTKRIRVNHSGTKVMLSDLKCSCPV